MTLAELLSPIDVSSFLDAQMGKTYVLLPGNSNRFSGWVSWTDISRELSDFRTNEMRVRVVRHGKAVPSSEYLSAGPDSYGSKIMSSRLESLFRSRATVVVQHAEEVFHGLRDIWLALTTVFRTDVDAVLFATLGDVAGLVRHWDPNDTFICQISGRKQWSVYAPGTLHPVGPSTSGELGAHATPAWHGMLNPGDLLYMPRGWPHEPVPLDEPSIHVTFAVTHPTGLSLVHWLSEGLARFENVRDDLPLLASAARKLEYISKLRENLAQQLSDDAIDRFYAWRDSKTVTSRQMNLNRSPVMSAHVDAAAGLLVRDYKRLKMRARDESNYSIVVGTKEYFFSAPLLPALTILNDSIPCSLENLEALVPATAHSAISTLVSLLLSENVLIASPD